MCQILSIDTHHVHMVHTLVFISPLLFAILNCLLATVGEFTIQIPPIKITMTLGTAIMAETDAANPPVTNKHTAMVDATSFDDILFGLNLSDEVSPSSSDEESSDEESSDDDKLSVRLDCLLVRSGSLRAEVAACFAVAAAAPAEYLPLRRIPSILYGFFPKYSVVVGLQWLEMLGVFELRLLPY